ncbi:MAG: Curli production assembly/transport component CsgG [Verrucomicrobia bacterium ADurb.Bin345]|nr:MAG: Curli production assembly/transport component CsgG [Verrucomicrobia bacterium ADurb.Bin345]
MRKKAKAGCVLWGLGALLCVGLSGCATSDHAHFMSTPSDANIYVAPGYKEITKVAIMPFKASTELIGLSVSDMFVTESLRAGRYELVERNQMAHVLGEAELALAGVSDSKAAQLGSMMGADAVIIGTVDEYGASAQRGKTFPVVGISARMIDCQTGKIVWSVDLAKRASSSSTPLSQHARAVVHEMMSALYKKWIR